MSLFLGLPVQHRLAGEAYIFCCCAFFFFFGHRLSRVGPSGVRRYYANSVAPSAACKLCTDIRPMLPPFLQGAKCPKFWPKFRPRSSSDRHIFELLHFIGKQTNLSRTDDRPTTIPNLGWVGPPTPRTVGAMGTPKGKSGKFLIYPPFQRPTPSTPPPVLYHLLGP